VALPPRFSRVQEAISAYYYGEAKKAWAKGDYLRAVVTAKAAIVKAPGNLDARLFLAECWRQGGRYDQAIHTLREGIPFNAADSRLQSALINYCLSTDHFTDLLAVLRTELPARGVRLLDGTNKGLELAEVRAVLDTAGAAEADKTAAGHPNLASDPEAAPLLARIDWEVGRKTQALERLRVARDHLPTNAIIQDAYIQMAVDMNKTDEARTAAMGFLRAFPTLLTAQLRFLGVYKSRQGADEKAWVAVSMAVLVQNRHDPVSLSKLGSLAGSEGWSDLAFLLYQNSLQENLTGFPFAIYYAASLIKSGNLKTADSVFRDLSIRNAAQVASASYLAAMVDWGLGRESEAMQIVQQLRRETADDLARRRTIESVFRSFGYPKVADELAKGPS
jgi:tetratricopeptide (TPR) repeat protein